MWPNPICPPAPKSASPAHFSVQLVAALCSKSFSAPSSLYLPMPHLSPAVTEVFPKHQRGHIIPSLSPPCMFKHLQWLPIANQITFKPFALVFKAIPQNGPNLSSQLLPCSLINCYTFLLLCLCSPPSPLSAMLYHLLPRGFTSSQVKFKLIILQDTFSDSSSWKKHLPP